MLLKSYSSKTSSLRKTKANILLTCDDKVKLYMRHIVTWVKQSEFAFINSINAWWYYNVAVVNCSILFIS